MLTGQSPQTHGVIANGVPLPVDAPSVARHLRRAAGYRTALVGKAYDTNDDPKQWHNRWSDPSLRRLRDELIDELRARLPPERTPPLPFASPT